jgi:L-asparaginase II
VTLAPLAYVTRSGFREGVHHGSAVALDADGTTLITLGDPDLPMLPRSTLKPLQAVAMLREGLELEGPLLALAAASHSGEAYHLDGVSRLLASAGLDDASLGNVADLPIGVEERLRWQRLALAPTRLAMNCSGKHAAMLATCVVNGWPTGSYPNPAHPLQRAIAATVEELTGEPIAAIAVDGCGAPAFALSLTGLARAFGRLATAGSATVGGTTVGDTTVGDTTVGGDILGGATVGGDILGGATVGGHTVGNDTPEGKMAHAVRTHPEWLGGTAREVTELIRSVPGLIAKEGAECVYAAALPDGRAVAMKIADGSDRARQVVMAGLLQALGVSAPGLDTMTTRPVLGNGQPVGVVSFAGVRDS